MKRFIHRKDSIYFQMLFLLAAAAAIAGSIFLLLEHVSESLVEHNMDLTNYAMVRNREAAGRLQEYITENRLYSRDEEMIGRWVRQEKLLSVSIYKDGIQVFDSDYPDQQIWNEEIIPADYEWIRYDSLEFEDGPAETMITGAWRYEVYSCIRIIELGVCFLIFLIVVLLGIRGKMRYIRQLSDEVEVLESGTLHSPVTVKGNDELSVLAEGLDSMRKNFLESQERESAMIREHQRVITEMSHDLRTPITSIMLYTEILQTGKGGDEKQQKQYIEKISQKALQVKERTDGLLKYSLGSPREKKTEMEEGPFKEAFYDLLSETCGYLEQRGFQTELHTDWPQGQIRYNTDYLVRIMDNIMSNIVKYADSRYPVGIRTLEEGRGVGFMFHNQIALTGAVPEGNGIGIRSVQSMMKEMGGNCRSECKEKIFRVWIIFPVLDTEHTCTRQAQEG